ncbi:MAG: hypothetical protein QGH45_10360 [Myxococcota bacterium]|jgi:hypothetical protein|nr:hypothetical protein [Myxococcota bacterium]
MRWNPTGLLPVLAAVLLAAPSSGRADPTWAEVQSIDDWIEHSVRQHDDAGAVRVLRTTLDEVYCFRAEATVDLTPKLLLGVALDFEGAIRWSGAGVTEAAQLSREGLTYDYYQYLDVPDWTLTKDRVWFLRGTVIRDGAALGLRWERLEQGGDHKEIYDDFFARHPKAIEVPVNVGAWMFTPSDDGTVVEYTICSVQGGNLPIKLGMQVTTTTLPDNVGDLVREARRRAAD